MSTADELFMGVNPEEPHIVVREDRVIIVPDDLKTIAVQHDHNIETVTFDCPRYWDGHDLSELDIKINYKLSNGFKGAYPCLDVVIDTEDDNMMHFTWTISNIVTQTSGAITFLICATTLNVDGTANQAWHTKPCKDLLVAEGMDCVGVEDVEPDPAFLDTKENVVNKVQEINTDSTAVQYPSAPAVVTFVENTSDDTEEIMQNMLAPYYLNLESIANMFTNKRMPKHLRFVSNATSASRAFYGVKGVKTAVLELPECTGMNQLFATASDLEELTIIGDKVTVITSFVAPPPARPSKLRKLNFPNISNVVSGSVMIANAPELTDVTIPEGCCRTTIGFPTSHKLTLESLTSIINGLADWTGETSVRKLIIGTTNYNKLTPELIQLIADKNWTVS